MSSSDLECPFCNVVLEIDDDLIGQEIKCPSCSKVITKIAGKTLKATFENNRRTREPHNPFPVPRQSSQQNGNSLQTLAIIIIFILLIGVTFLALSFFQITPRPKFEYTYITFPAENLSRTGFDASKDSSIKLDQTVLNKMGGDGWEMVGSYLEMETAFPNFGNSDYVAGIKPNIRPQCLVAIFKRRIYKNPNVTTIGDKKRRR